MIKPRSDSRLFKLTDQQAQLLDWIHQLGYVKAKELAALPPPGGFGIKTHLNSLCRFVAQYSETQEEREFFDSSAVLPANCIHKPFAPPKQ